MLAFITPGHLGCAHLAVIERNYQVRGLALDTGWEVSLPEIRKYTNSQITNQENLKSTNPQTTNQEIPSVRCHYFYSRSNTQSTINIKKKSESTQIPEGPSCDTPFVTLCTNGPKGTSARARRKCPIGGLSSSIIKCNY